MLAITFGPDLEINPPTQDYLTSELSRAANDGYDAAVILLDTPGGLSTSMKTIYQAELASKIPVIVYVSPAGARAASAGSLGRGSRRRARHVADLEHRLLDADRLERPEPRLRPAPQDDQRRRRRTDGARGDSSPQHGVADEGRARRVEPHRGAGAEDARDRLRRAELPALLKTLDGYHTKDAQRPFTLHLANAEIDTVKPGFITRFLNTIIDPNLISLLFLLGIIGLVFEVLHPGIVLPGALGAVSLVLALYGFSVLTPSWGGLALMLLGVALLVIDLHSPTHGVLTTGGLISLLFGLALLFQNAPGLYRVNLWLIIGIGAAIGIFWAFATGKALAAQTLAGDDRRADDDRADGRGARAGARLRRRRALAGGHARTTRNSCRASTSRCRPSTAYA